MHKVYTITCHNVINHGAQLQEWALMRFLRLRDFDATIIDYQPSLSAGNSVPQKYNRPLLRWLYRLAKYRTTQFLNLRKKAFDVFYSKYIEPYTTREVYPDFKSLRHNPPQGEAYIAGSDQIWNTDFRNGNDPAFYLDFGSKEIKRLSYAASFATERLKLTSVEFVKKQLGNFDYISVRESSGLKILSELGYSGVLVCDPIFLPEIKEYDAMNDSIALPKKNYIVVYDFDASEEIKTVAQRLAKLKGYEIVSVGPWSLSYAKYDHALCTPDAFVWLIRNASCVISNSFHGSAFSLLFNRNFFVVERADGLNARMADLLKRYGASDHIITSESTDEELCSDIDYDKVNPLLSRDIAFSRNWLISHL